MIEGHTLDQAAFEKIQALLDTEEIKNLRIRYAQYLDGNNIEKMNDFFSNDAKVKVTAGVMNGIEEIKNILKQAYKDFDRDGRGFYPFMHAIVNHSVTLLGPDDAVGSCYLVDFETASKQENNPLLLLGLYSDRYRRIDGQWRIVSSDLKVVWPNKISEG